MGREGSSTRVLAIDQSSCSGWAVMDDETLVAYGLIDLTSIHSERLSIFNQRLAKLIDDYAPGMLAWENLKSNNNPDTIRKLAEYTGVLRLTCEELEIPYIEVVPISVKAANVKTKGSGKRGAKTKIDLARVICKLYDLQFPKIERGANKGDPVKNEAHKFFNITDAIGIARYCFLKGED